MAQQIYRLLKVKQLTELSRATIYRLMARGEFPKQIHLTQRSIGWHAADVDAWIASRPFKTAASQEAKQ